MTRTFISGDWHGWDSNGQFLLSNEYTKELTSHVDTDAAINFLYLGGNLNTARALHAMVKANPRP